MSLQQQSSFSDPQEAIFSRLPTVSTCNVICASSDTEASEDGSLRDCTRSLETFLSSRLSGGIRCLRRRSRHCNYGGRLCHQDPSDWHNLGCCLEAWAPYRSALLPADSMHSVPLDERCQKSLCCERARLPVCAGMAFNVKSCCHAMLMHSNVKTELCVLKAFHLCRKRQCNSCCEAAGC